MDESARARVRSIQPSLLCLTLAILSTPASARALQSCSPERVNLGIGGAPSQFGSYTLPGSALSADGSCVLWCSRAPDFVPGDTNDGYDVFLRDRQTGTTERVSVDSAGLEGSNGSGVYGFDVSADGNRIAFTSAARLAPNDTQSFWDVYVHDRTTGQTVLVSLSAAGNATAGHSLLPVISGDGRFVAFVSDAIDLVPGDTNLTYDTFVRDTISGTTERVNVSSTGSQAHSPWVLPDTYPNTVAISADGRFVAFASGADNLIAGDTNVGDFEPDGQDIFVRDRLLGITTRVSVGTGNVEANSFSDHPFLSADGRYVAFQSNATNLTPEGFPGVFVHDRQSGQTSLVSLSTSGLPSLPGNSPGRISGDGRYVLFGSTSPAFFPGDTNGSSDVFLRDRQTASTRVVSSASVLANDDSFGGSLSADGSVILFGSEATNLILGDTNASMDFFVSECPPVSFEPFCSATASACPCGNAGGTFSGCENSLATGGARLTASGAASLSNDTLVLEGFGMPDSSALYFQGTARQSGGAGTVFGDGLRCVTGSIVRIATRMNSGHASSYPVGSASSVSQRGQVLAPGFRHYQIWYRNAAAYCTPATYNLTNGVTVDWQS